jgi:hypothetical protein
MAKTLQVSGYLLFNTSSLDSSGSVDIEHTKYGYGTYTSSSFSASAEFTDLHPHIIITEVVDQKPCVNFGNVEWTFDDLTDVTGSWNYFSQSLQGDLKTAIINKANISSSHFGEIYTLRVQDTDLYYSDDEDYDVGHYKKYRSFEDGVLMESYLLPVTKSDGPYSIPPWS